MLTHAAPIPKPTHHALIQPHPTTFLSSPTPTTFGRREPIGVASFVRTASFSGHTSPSASLTPSAQRSPLASRFSPPPRAPLASHFSAPPPLCFLPLFLSRNQRVEDDEQPMDHVSAHICCPVPARKTRTCKAGGRLRRKCGSGAAGRWRGGRVARVSRARRRHAERRGRARLGPSGSAATRARR
ncbi:hypothetical protein D1007_40536 [Hordeum vulgare]|nr:hypothetical protein D1007_40536 [Hordeum vulgare]